ncbi:hypothetical protein DFH06DRAFT_1134240 [Mycena polygramma]|nr:hypothetical protein DFH06DRAFT_1134240 [Mycena polygramma]
MPPKAQRREDFGYNEDNSQARCKSCGTGTWIAVASIQRHLKSDEHLKSKQIIDDEAAKRKREELERERQAASATTNLGITTHLNLPIAGTSSASLAKGEVEAEFWANYEANGAVFSAGEDVEDPRVRHEQLGKEADLLGFWNPEAVARGLGFGNESAEDQILAEDEEEDFLAEIMRQAGIDDPEPADIQDGGTRDAQPSPDSEWFPYPSKLEANCKNVPSFDHLRRIQKSIRSECGIPTIPCKSVQGNVFFMNDPAAIVAQDWANPTTRKLIHVYPEIPKDGIIREIWHAQKWCAHMDLDILSPMYDAGNCHYYVNEVLRLKNGLFVIPIRWIMFEDKVHADVFSITFNDDAEATVLDHETSLVCSDEFQNNYFDLEHIGKVPKWADVSIKSGYPDRMPNPKRIMAGGDPLYCSFVDYFGDDVSGNRTKSWNKHWNAYMTHRNLPRQLLHQEFHVHFISTSPNASITEQFNEFKGRLEATHTEPMKVEDETGATTRFCIHCNSGPSDNPMQSEITGHIGGKGNHYCRKCKAGGTQKYKTTDEGYHTLFEPGVPRTKEGILSELEKQVKLACSGVAQHVKNAQTDTGVKDMYTQYWIDQLIGRFKEMKKDDPSRSDADITAELVAWTEAAKDQIYSGFLTMKGFDRTRDTPVEILHTILLGIVKYIWHISHTSWSDENKKTYALRLQSTTTDGLSIHAIRSSYIMQYAGSLIGRQFKTLVQTNIFHVRGLVTDHKFAAWKAIGELAALLWVPEIRNMPEYRKDLKVAVANVLDIFAMIDPSKIITKIKQHLLVHLEEDVVEVGPLIGMMTEVFECFNGIFRYCSILSNHLAPSRDIAKQLGDQEGLKHRLTGGRWQHSGKDWKRAGPAVRQFMAKHPILQRLLGWTVPETMVHGMDFIAQQVSSSFSFSFAGEAKAVSLVHGQKERVSYALEETSAALALNFGMYSPKSTWTKCVHVMSEALDKCFIGSWVFAKSASDANIIITGRVKDILKGKDSMVVIVLELFQVLSSRDDRTGMPVLNIRFKVNVQHDCDLAKCEPTGVRLRMQERVESDQIENYIVHEPLDRYIINSHSFHNAHLRRATLPRDLVETIPLFPDRQALHMEQSTTLRATLETRRVKLKTAASKKRKANEDVPADEPPQKRRKKTKGKQAPPQPVVVPNAALMVATRSKRKVVQSSKAKAMAEGREDEEEEEDELMAMELDLEDDLDDVYLDLDSDGDHSD